MRGSQRKFRSSGRRAFISSYEYEEMARSSDETEQLSDPSPPEIGFLLSVPGWLLLGV